MDLHHRLLSRLSTLFLLYFLYSFHFISIDGAVNHPTKPITSFCIGGSGHACAVFDTFQMKCWGHEINLGMDDTGSNVIGDSLATVGDNIPYFSPGASLSITKVSCSSDSVCILLNTTDIKCFGTNGYGKLGIGNDNVAYIGAISGFLGDRLPVVNLGTGITASSVASGSDHVCVLVTGNKVKCFGFNAEGQLGYGNTNNKGYSLNDMGDNLPFVDFGTNAEIASIHTGTWHSCVILSAPPASVEKFKCWGQNSNGQLGYGTSGSTSHLGDAPGEMGENLPLVDLGSESKVKQLALGFSHSCALLNNDALKCWGSGSDGRLGSGSTTAILSTGDSMPTVSIDTLKTIKFVTAGSGHTCIVYDDNLIMKCFGDNQFGQLGQGDTTDRGGTVPTKIPNIPAINLGTGSLQISSIYTSSSANCVIFTDSSIKCFGANNFGMFAIGSSNSVGAGSGDMGSNLQFSELFSPTQSPTIAPTNSPTPPTLPTSSPSTKRPSRSPTTRRPSKSPTKSPTPPTLAPSDTPTQNPTDSPSPTKAPTSSPTDSPTKKVDDYLPSKIDCHQYTERAKCIAETNGECGTCVYFSEKVRYAFRVRVNFVMNRGGRFIDFDNPNATPPKTAFRDAIKAVIKAELGGKDTISITRIGQIYQTLGVDSGYTDFDINFDDSDSDRVKTRAFLTSKPNLYDYIDDLNLQLNKKMKTTGKNYITGRISIDNLNIVDLAQGKGSCGCNEETGSNAANLKLSSMVAVVVSILIAFLII